MAGLRVEQYVVGPVMTNCYFAIHEDTKEMLVIDPGDEALHLIEKIKACGAKPVAILLTHGHFDHASAAQEIAENFGIQIYAHEDEKETLENPSINLCGMVGIKEIYHADCYVKDGEILNLAGFEIKVLHTPGHTKGGCCYYIEKEQAVFSGDTLFNSSVGRTDFPGGSATVLLRSIEEKLMPMPGQTKVYPGHNDTTTIGWEKQYNPFL
ncbi:MAG: MBL fold metallo-hydrolase [Lachnospiraceae bacterium]|nr:MBL fold metallo-hydrolase [Lachnospiraceae bacterium]